MLSLNMSIPRKQGIAGLFCALFVCVVMNAWGNEGESVIAWGVPWGWSGSVHVPGDYDGDGINDLAVFDTDGGNWYILSLNENLGLVHTNEFQGAQTGSYFAPMVRISGKIVNLPVREGSVVIMMRDVASGYGSSVLFGTFSDNGVGQLNGSALLEGVVPISGVGSIDYMTGEWHVNLALPGLVGSFNIYASYLVKSQSPKIIAWRNQWGWNGAKPIPGDYDGDGQSDLAVVDQITGKWYIKSLKKSSFHSSPHLSQIGVFIGIEPQGAVSGSYAVPLTKFGGNLNNRPIIQGSVTIFLRDQATGALLGTFNDTGWGQLQGTALLEGVVPINGLGEINYLTGVWYVNLSLPGLVGSYTLSASYRFANP